MHERAERSFAQIPGIQLSETGVGASGLGAGVPPAVVQSRRPMSFIVWGSLLPVKGWGAAGGPAVRVQGSAVRKNIYFCFTADLEIVKAEQGHGVMEWPEICPGRDGQCRHGHSFVRSLAGPPLPRCPHTAILPPVRRCRLGHPRSFVGCLGGSPAGSQEDRGDAFCYLGQGHPHVVTRFPPCLLGPGDLSGPYQS